MILLFDIGNTNIVLGINENDQITETFRFVTDSTLTVDDYYQKIDNVLKTSLKKQTVEGAIISSVVPALDNVFLRLLAKYYHVKAMIVGPGIKSGLKIKIENPKELGADLLCDAVGAYLKYNGPTIIVDMGTVTKLFVVTANKEFIGGAICVGLKGGLESLVNTTSKLARTAIVAPEKVISNETSSCIQSGIVYGHVAMIDGLIAKMKKELNQDNVKVVLTGGYAPVVKDYLNTPVIYDENVLLEGLYHIYQKNLSNK